MTDRRGDVDVLVREKFYVGIHESEALCGCLSAGLRDSVGLVLFFSSVSSVLGPTTLTLYPPLPQPIDYGTLIAPAPAPRRKFGASTWI